MNGCLVILRSVTYAQRAKRILEKAGISAYIVKPDVALLGEGCSFAVKISEGYLAETLEILRAHKFDIIKVFVSERGGYRELKS